MRQAIIFKNDGQGATWKLTVILIGGSFDRFGLDAQTE